MKPLPAMRSSRFRQNRRFHSLPCGFMRIHFSTINRFGDLLGCNFLLCSHIRGASPNFLFARHGCYHRSFQFSPRIFESFFVLLVIRTDKVNSSQSSSIDRTKPRQSEAEQSLVILICTILPGSHLKECPLAENRA